MNILLASSEIVPFAKTGGLADVAGALPRELERLGHDVTLFMPAYRCVFQTGQPIEATNIELEIPLGSQLEKGRISKGKLNDSNVTVYFLEHARYFDRPSLYGEEGQDYPDNCERFTFFCRGVLDSIQRLGLRPDIIHVNDWQTGLIPALLACEYHDHPNYANIATLITIHNLAYQGVFGPDQMAVTGLDAKYFNWQQMEFHGLLNLLKTGIVFSDSINTVSKTYANEIQSAEQGCGLEGILRHRANRLTGILNGIDISDWNPKTDPHIATNFDANFNVATGSTGKLACKKALQLEANLDVDPSQPLIGIVGRLAAQKGWSLILPVMRKWLEEMDAQWVILGTGDPNYHHALQSLQRSYPRKLALRLDFSNELAHRIEAGSDLFLMPSEYEPCGLNQMYSMAYGTIPVVRRTGGLADTVIDASPATIENRTATGFAFTDFHPVALEETMARAIRLYHDARPVWNQLMLNGMKHDWSWRASAKQYEALYRTSIFHHSMI